MGQYPYQLFSKNPTYAFTPVEDVSGMDNWEILHRWIGKITNAGYDVMIRDVSYLGFPSFHIIIPGLSEMVYPSDLQFRATNTRYYVSNILRDCPEKINAKIVSCSYQQWNISLVMRMKIQWNHTMV